MLEIEAKYYLGDESAARELCLRWGLAWMEGVLETNRIFDFDDRRLAGQGALVRVRTRPDSASLTYKHRTDVKHAGAKVRAEYDTRVTEPAAVTHLLEALGLKEVLRYERLRATHPLEDVVIEIDRLPGGWFCEIEGSPESIVRRAAQAGLDRSRAIAWSYPEVFRRLGALCGFEPRAWTFEFADEVALSIPSPGDPWWKTAAES